ncbi:MAG: hypothetical protein KF760_21795 [Candidatus Eremiobacteraeota bacterium]|nr:hypothetical protein [Candidatus Eremiobacteraeota bacterium]
MNVLLEFLKPPENQGMAVPESTLRSLDASSLQAEPWRRAVQVRTPLNGPPDLPRQLLLPFFYACPVSIDASLYQGLAEVVNQANQFLRRQYSEVSSLVRLFSEALEQLLKPELRKACEQLGLWPFFRPDTINRYARLIHRQLSERVPNLMLDFALSLGPGGRACLVVTEMQATHPYFSFTRMVEATAEAGLAPRQAQAWSGSDPARSLSELAQENPVLVIDAAAEMPELLRQLRAQGVQTSDNQVRYPAGCQIPVESRVDRLCPAGPLAVGQESIAQPLFSPFVRNP